MVTGEEKPGLAESGGDHVKGRALDVGRNLLLEPSHSYASLPNDSSRVGKNGRVEELHDCALAGAVSSDKADPLSALNRKIGAMKDRRAPECDADVLHAQQGHGALVVVMRS